MRSLDSIVAEWKLAPPAYLKIDVEGAEREILEGAPRALADLLVIKTEVGFLRFRQGQPLAAELDLFLRDHGFELMDFTDPANWRINGYVIHPQVTKGAIPYSRGRLMQGDYLYFRRPETIPAEPERHFQLAALAMAHGYFDHAQQVLSHPDVATWLAQTYGVEPSALVAEASRRYSRDAWLKELVRHLRLLWTFARSGLNLASR